MLTCKKCLVSLLVYGPYCADCKWKIRGPFEWWNWGPK